MQHESKGTVHASKEGCSPMQRAMGVRRHRMGLKGTFVVRLTSSMISLIFRVWVCWLAQQHQHQHQQLLLAVYPLVGSTGRFAEVCTAGVMVSVAVCALVLANAAGAGTGKPSMSHTGVFHHLLNPTQCTCISSLHPPRPQHSMLSGSKTPVCVSSSVNLSSCVGSCLSLPPPAVCLPPVGTCWTATTWVVSLVPAALVWCVRGSRWQQGAALPSKQCQRCPSGGHPHLGKPGGELLTMDPVAALLVASTGTDCPVHLALQVVIVHCSW